MGDRDTMGDRDPSSRRRFLGTGTAALAAVWAAPGVRSVRLGQAAGSPPPGPSTTIGETSADPGGPTGSP